MFVKYDKDKQHVPIKIWRKDSSEVEEGCIEQALNASNLPFAFHHIALLSDCHQGYGAPIGGVMASKGYVCPSFVGKDIGCGMGYIQTNVPVASFKDVKTKDGQNLVWAMLSNITRNIPVGFNHHKTPQDHWCTTIVDGGIKIPDWGTITDTTIVKQEYESSLMQLGTLGGGK